MFVSDDIRNDHHDGITYQSSPRAGHISIDRNENKVSDQGNDRSNDGQVSAPFGLAGELIPDGEIQKDTEAEIC